MLPKRSIIRIFDPLLAAAIFLAACGIIPGNQAAATKEAGTPVPTPTKDPSGYQAILQPQSCQIADFPAMQSDKPQGDLVAWQPGEDNLAYMAPAERSSWYIGDLMLAVGPDFNQRTVLTPGILASGDLTWSPDGSQLAFLAFRPNENVYTVMTIRPDGTGLTDLFPTDLARTDARTSQKAILGWKNDVTVVVMSSCGEECRQAYDIQVSASAGNSLVPTPVANYRDLTDSLQIHSNLLDFKPEQFPKGMRSPNWSPDQNMVAYLDKRGLLWLLSIPDKISYLLDIGLRVVHETQWASDNHYLGIRAEDRIFVFQVPCQGQKK